MTARTTVIPLPVIPTVSVDVGSTVGPRGRSSSSPHLEENSSRQSLLKGFTDQSTGQKHRALRKPSPGLLARMKLLDNQNRSRVSSHLLLAQDKIGRIPESQLRELEGLHRDHLIVVERRGRAWSGPHPRLTPQLTDGSTSETAMGSQVDGYDSEQSSVVSTSETMTPSDLGKDDSMDNLTEDTLRYWIPDVDGTRHSSHKDLRPEEDQTQERSRPPTPPPKDSPRRVDPPARREASANGALSGNEPTDVESYFNPYGLSRATSIYSLSRVSFTNQLSQLTSIKLPQASSLSSSISSLPTSIAAARALNDAADQIGLWMRKASEVLDGLDADNDVEWAAAGGREGHEEVDAAINTFETLIDVYVTAIEELQSREDIESLGPQGLQALVDRMEVILKDWKQIRETLKGVKEQVEVAMEWEELWTTVLGEIGLEMEALSRLVFEMEERRHRTAISETMADSGSGFDIGELETIVEEAPVRGARPTASNRFSLPPAFPASSPIQSPTAQVAQEDSNLLALFARMQPLRASLDFLPMRLQVFQARGESVFPTACEDLEKRRTSLENQWKKLEADAESLRKELGEDRWVLVFRNAGRQALKMCESVTRSLTKLQEAIAEGGVQENLSSMAKKVESYEAKRMHYGPAIEKVLAIIDRGVKDRLTVNGEILRLQSDLKRRWAELEDDMKGTDFVLDELNLNKTQALRDSISTILSTDLSVGSSAIETPASSPASSVVVTSRKSSDQGASTPYVNGKPRQSSLSSSTKTQTTSNKRYSSLPTSVSSSTSQLPRKTPLTRSSASTTSAYERSPSPASRTTSATPTSSRSPRTPSISGDQPARPRWNSSTNLNGTVIGHDFRSRSTTTPTPHRKAPQSPQVSSSTSPSLRSIRTVSTHSAIPIPSPLSRNFAFSLSPSASPSVAPARPPSALSTPHGSAPPSATRASLPTSPQTPLLKSPPSRASKPHVPSSGIPAATSGRRNASLGSVEAEEAKAAEASPSPSARATKAVRPPSAMAEAKAAKRVSMLPQPKAKTARRESVVGGRNGSAGVAERK